MEYKFCTSVTEIQKHANLFMAFITSLCIGKKSVSIDSSRMKFEDKGLCAMFYSKLNQFAHL